MLSESGSPRIAELFGEGKGRSRRLGVQQRALPQHALGCLDSARDLHRGAGWERALGRRSEPGQSAFFFFFFLPLISCVVCLKILQHSFAAFLAPTECDGLKKQDTQGSRPSDAAKIHPPSCSIDLTRMNLENKSMKTKAGVSQTSKLLQSDANTHLTFLL